MGFFRFLLAALVMLSHLPGTYYKTNYGQIAVLGFYFVSGYLMALMYSRFKTLSPHPTYDFFLDRVFKLWPSYLLVLAASYAFYTPTDIRPAQLTQLWSELLMLPNAYTKLLQFNDHYLLIPQTWSLGVELHFYLIVPLLAVLSYRTKIIIAYVLSFLHLKVLTSKALVGEFIPSVWPIRPVASVQHVSDYVGFDLPFLIVVVFLFGHLSYEKFVVRKSDDPHLYIIWAIYAFCLFFLFPYKGWIARISTNEVLLSVTCFLPIALSLLLLSRLSPSNVYDRIAGALSYPLFLTHFFAKDVVVYFFGKHSENPHMILRSIVLSIVLAALVAAFQVWIVDRARYRVRGFNSLQRSSSQAT